MKYRKRVFAMDAAELRAALSLLCPERHDLLVGPADRGTLQEELVQWLLSEGLSARHEFLLYREDSPQNESNYEDGVEQEEEQKVWLLSRRTRGCPCCDASDGQRASPMPSPCPTPAERRSPSPRPQQQKQKQQPPAKVERPRKEAVSPATAVVFRPTHLQTAEASRGRKAHNTGMPSNSSAEERGQDGCNSSGYCSANAWSAARQKGSAAEKKVNGRRMLRGVRPFLRGPNLHIKMRQMQLMASGTAST